MTDAELARHAQRAYLLAQQHGGDPWVAVARMMRAQLCEATQNALEAAAVAGEIQCEAPGECWRVAEWEGWYNTPGSAWWRKMNVCDQHKSILGRRAASPAGPEEGER